MDPERQAPLSNADRLRLLQEREQAEVDDTEPAHREPSALETHLYERDRHPWAWGP